jgi:hypothetical protein
MAPVDVFAEILNAEFVEAARIGDYHKVRSLVEDGADLNSADDGAGSLLAKATERGRRGIRSITPETPHAIGSFVGGDEEKQETQVSTKEINPVLAGKCNFPSFETWHTKVHTNDLYRSCTGISIQRATRSE